MFTSSQIEEIRKKLQLGGTKDTQFPLAGALEGNETMAIVQQGQNKQLGLKTLIEKVGMYTMSDFINLSKSSEDSYTLEEVIKLVEPVNRKAGQVITFMDSSTGDWAIYQFKGNTASEWFNLELWDNILAKVDNHFKGWFKDIDSLIISYPKPHAGDFAFVGEDLSNSLLYTSEQSGYWINTNTPALVFADKYKAVYSEDFNDFFSYLDESYADRAVCDIYGRYIHDTYITKTGLSKFVTEKVLTELAKQIVNVQLQDNSVTLDKLSEGVKQLLKSGGAVTNLPDDEDITVNSDNQLKFADKEYNANTYTGYGRKYLRRNIIDGINTLEQSMMKSPNTRYIVQYDYCLGGKTINVPKDCILDLFAGGNFVDGVLECDNTLILAPDPEALTVSLTGTYRFFGNTGKSSDIRGVKITQAEYDSLEVKNPNTFYLITE